MVKSVIDVRTGRGLVSRIIHNLEDIKAIEKIIEYVGSLIDEFKVSAICAVLW